LKSDQAINGLATLGMLGVAVLAADAQTPHLNEYRVVHGPCAIYANNAALALQFWLLNVRQVALYPV
jgi:hypothetical protein